MAVGARHLIPAAAEEIQGLELDGGTVITDDGRKVELEKDAHLPEPAVVRLRHIVVAFGMGQNGAVALGKGLPQRTEQVDRRGHDRGLDQDAVLSMQEQVLRLQPFFIEIVDHVFGGKQQLDAALVLLPFQALVTGPEVFRRVREVLHDMGRQPQATQAMGLEQGKDGQRLVQGPDTVVHAVEKVAVVVSTAPKQVAANEGLLAAEEG